MQTLKNAVKNKVEQHALDSDQLSRLLARQDHHPMPQITPRLHSRAIRGWCVAASLLLLSLLIFPYLTSDRTAGVQAIAEEVVKNHLHQKPLEIESSQLALVSPYFDRLDFRPIDSELLDRQEYQLLGGRYCSLQGITAAQLRYTQHGSYRKQTLYQVGYDAKIFSQLPDIGKGEKPVVTYAKGIQVRIWLEHGVLFALTSE